MHVIKRHKKITAAIVALFMLALAGTAFAIYTSQSNGTGTVTGTGTVSAPPTVPVDLGGSFSSSSLAPGVSTSVTIQGDSASPVTVGSVHLASVTIDSAHATAGCLGSWFTMPDVVVNQTFSSPMHNTPLGTGTLTFTSVPGNQNACGGATVSLVLTSN